LFWNLPFAHTEAQGKLKKEDLIKSILDKIRSKCIQNYFSSATVAVDGSKISFRGRITFKINNFMKTVEFGMKMFVLSDSTNRYGYGYVYEYEYEYICRDTKI
jgi:hypothetical protein